MSHRETSDSGTPERGSDDAATVRLERLLELIPGIVYTLELQPEGPPRITWISGSVAQLGYSRTEALAPNWWAQRLHPEDRDRVLSEIARLPDAGRVAIEYRLAGRNGQYVGVHDDVVVAPGAAGAGTLLVGTIVTLAQGRDTGAPSRSPATPTGQAPAGDAPERARLLEGLSLLTADIAQDLSNVLMRAHRATDDLSPHLYSSTIKAIEASLEHCSTLARELGAYAKEAQPEPGPVSPRQLCTDVARELRQILPVRIRVVVHAHPDTTLPDMRGTRAAIHDALVRLGRNAAEAMPDGGAVTISAERQRFTPDSLPPTAAARPGTYVVLTVSDSGRGIPEDIRERVLDPFVTSRPADHRGVGLSMVARTTRRAGGFVWARSEPDRGTAVNVALPLAEPDASAPTQTAWRH